VGLAHPSKRYPILGVDGGPDARDIGFLASMLAVVGLEAGVCCFMAYRVLRRSEQIEATYLEARKGLSQSR
jgi:hypothetical protein